MNVTVERSAATVIRHIRLDRTGPEHLLEKPRSRGCRLWPEDVAITYEIGNDGWKYTHINARGPRATAKGEGRPIDAHYSEWLNDALPEWLAAIVNDNMPEVDPR